ncbi:uncharacterized protein LOC100366817 [Saccoglossus kowalevskii]|uniref:70 kDa peptidyl-prolyl isomerase-like n=1 Tax=Saccoglossus kowalevskii TaxID=10224 RepID=A0ABM0GT05_SACKO|nr:PREDICTED: 70 kDa peptidyl-prolyl isomerase-like [Saccoglossus kowalevskii]
MDDMDTGDRRIWSPYDKSFTKVTLIQGSGLASPNEGATCIVEISRLTGGCHVTDDVVGYPLGKETKTCIGEYDADLSEIVDGCLETMKEGEVCELHIPESTLMERIGVDYLCKMRTTVCVEDVDKLNIILKIELKQFTKVIEKWKMSQEKKIETAEYQKGKGNVCFQQGKTVLAARRYSKALKSLITVVDMKHLNDLPVNMKQHYTALKCSCSLNLAACLLKLKQFSNVVKLCSDALEIVGENVKGLYRRGHAFRKLGEFERAREDLTFAQRLEPHNKAVQDQIAILDRDVKELDDKYAKAMSKMFGGPVKS